MICRKSAPLRAISGLSQILVEDHQTSLMKAALIIFRELPAVAKRVATCPAHSTVWLLFWLMQDFRLPFIVRAGCILRVVVEDECC